MRPVEEILFRASRRRLRRLARADNPEVARTLDAAAYAKWRRDDLRRQLQADFDASLVAGKDVLDFGCGEGALALYLAELGARSVTGVDLSAELIERAQQSAKQIGDSSAAGLLTRRVKDGGSGDPPPSRLRFAQASDPTKIPCPDESFDLVCCFDALEHVMQPEAVVRQWRRVLRPGGAVWIWWSQWRNPYGHHLNSLVPLPWVHLLVSQQTLIRVAARIYDDPCFVPRVWDIDPATGNKKPNKWRSGTDLGSWLNRLTLRRFNRICRDAGLEMRVRARGLGSLQGAGLKRCAGKLAALPGVGECCTSYFAITLTKPADG